MKTFIILFLIAGLGAQAQKPVIDTGDFKQWSYHCRPSLSNDGKFVALAYSWPDGSRQLEIKSTDLRSSINVLHGNNPAFTENSKWIICKKENDTLMALQLPRGRTIQFEGVENYRVVANHPDLIVYKHKEQPNSVIARNLESGRERVYAHACQFYIEPGGRYMLLKVGRPDNEKEQSLVWVNLVNGDTTTIWQSEHAGGASPGNVFFAGSAPVLAFFTQPAGPVNTGTTLWMYRYGNKKAEIILNAKDVRLGAIDKHASLQSNYCMFNGDGSRVFLMLSDTTDQYNSRKEGEPVIWKSSDPVIPGQTSDLIPVGQWIVALNFESGAIAKISGRHEVPYYPGRNGKMDKVLVWRCVGDPKESNWNPEATSSYFVVNCQTGARRQILRDAAMGMNAASISPGGSWVVYYDPGKKRYCLHDVRNDTTYALPREITDSRTSLWDIPDPSFNMGGACEWIAEDSLLLLRDGYDVWKVNVQQPGKAVNLTMGHGKRNKIVYQVINPGQHLLYRNNQLLLSAFDQKNKYNGYAVVSLTKPAPPRKLSMGPYNYTGNTMAPVFPFNQIKAKNTELYVVRRMSATEAPNFYLTADFMHFKPVTNFAPHLSYNWLQAELISWKTFDGTITQGILYKPENFDSTQKYPVIVHFYEQMSDLIHTYLVPYPMEADLNIPWFVSRGYLVFVPDIHYKIGQPGESAYNCVLSGIQQIAGMPFVDTSRIAVQGHSFGGYQVNYLITRTNLFAAAMNAAGSANFVSGYNLTSHSGSSRTWVYERSQSRMGTTLWERPDLYLDNSPLMHAHKVTTPLLVMHCKKDDKVPWAEALQWFMALRRLGKKVWLLEYINGGHAVHGREALDLTIRTTQFFDHYLKGAAMPDWMK